MSQTQSVSAFPLWKRVLFSERMLGETRSRRIALIGVTAALCVAANFLEIKFFDVQFSFTIYVSILTGILIGPLFGFAASFLGDAIGYLVNSWGYLYMPWVGISSATFALIAGLVMNGIRLRFRGGGYVKLAIVCLLTFLICTVGINSTGFYFYNRQMGFSTAVLGYFEERFGGEATFFAYVCYRLFFKLQIVNSVVNYALVFLTVPILNSVKALRLKIE
ncbi:MAG: ECF transporter S component [Candidatus Gallimonas sp.]